MSADAVLVVADTLRKAIAKAEDDAYLHGAWNSKPELDPDEVAAAVVDALRGLEREWGSQMLGDDAITIGSEGTARFCAQQHPLTWTALSRWVSGWVREPAEENRDA